MAAITRLVSINQLKTDLLKKLANKGHVQNYLNYDKELDSLILLVIPPEEEIVVHYIDEEDFVALLYQANTLEIVGLQIEDFETGFLPKYASVEKIWRLSDCLKFENFWDLTLEVKLQQPKVAREIAKVAIPLLGEPAEKLERVFA